MGRFDGAGGGEMAVNAPARPKTPLEWLQQIATQKMRDGALL